MLVEYACAGTIHSGDVEFSEESSFGYRQWQELVVLGIAYATGSALALQHTLFKP